MKCYLMLTVLVLFNGLSDAQDHHVIYLIRHAEKVVSQGHDAELTTRGHHRAEHYADMFKSSAIRYIYSTGYKRTKMTAQPLATELGIQVITYEPDKLKQLAQQVKARPGNYFIVGHSNTTPTLVKLLGGESGLGIDEKKEFDRIYQLIITPSGQVFTQILRSLPVIQ